MPDQTVTELLTAWREAERALEGETDPVQRVELETRVESVRLQYLHAVDTADRARVPEPDHNLGQP